MWKSFCIQIWILPPSLSSLSGSQSPNPWSSFSFFFFFSWSKYGDRDGEIPSPHHSHPLQVPHPLCHFVELSVFCQKFHRAQQREEHQFQPFILFRSFHDLSIHLNKNKMLQVYSKVFGRVLFRQIHYVLDRNSVGMSVVVSSRSDRSAACWKLKYVFDPYEYVMSRVCPVVFHGKNLMLDITHLAIDSHAGQIFSLVDATKPAVW